MTGSLLVAGLLAAAAAGSPPAAAGPAQAPPAAPAAAPAEVQPSTATARPAPEDIPALKKRIREDHREVLKTRAALKKAQKGRDAAATERALEAWRQAREKLKSDRLMLRQAIEESETERARSRKLREELRKSESLKP